MENKKNKKAIETIDGLIYDFSDALDGLREIRELLYEIMESEPKRPEPEGRIHE